VGEAQLSGTVSSDTVTGTEADAHASFPLHRRWTCAIDQGIGWVVDLTASALVVAEIVILGAGVISRYLLKNPLYWTDELGSLGFLWLTMLGTISAYRRNGHMRVTLLRQRMSSPCGSISDVVNTLVVAILALGLLAAALWPTVPPETDGLPGLIASIASGDFFATGYLGQQATDFTPALEIPRTVEVFGIVAGLVGLLVLALMRLIDSRPRCVLCTAITAAAVGLVAYLGRDTFAALGNLNLILFFVVFNSVAIGIGIPIAFAFGAATISYLLLVTGVPLSIVIGQMTDCLGNLVLVAIPLFVLLGLLMESAGIARRLVELIALLVGRLRGGMYIVLVAAMFLVSGISGSKLADMAAVTPVLFPEMERRGYKRTEMIALLATSGAMAELIPPALVLIIVGTVCSVSIQSLFTGGLLPAVVASLFLIVTALIRAGNGGSELKATDGAKSRWRAFVVALPGLALPFLIRFFVVSGLTTATEVSTAGVVYTLIVGLLVYREFDWRQAYPMLRETAVLTGAIVFMIATATAMSWALTQAGFATTLADVVEHAPGGKVTFVALSIILFIVLGSLLEGIPVIVLFGPLLFPIASQMGVNQVHYAIIVVLAMSIGMFAPPIGIGYYGACVVGKCDPDKAMLAMIPYLAALIGALLIIAELPFLSTILL
jgi:tripartite ATP-independent transporter DctM subunit